MTYCRTLTDAQVRGVLEKEAAAGRKGEELYREAREEAIRRGMDPDEYATTEPAEPAEDERPDYDVAREELAAMIERFGLAFGQVEHVPVRAETAREKRDREAQRARGEYSHLSFDCDPTAGRVRFTLYRKGPDGQPFGSPYSGTYRAGSGIVARWAEENRKSLRGADFSPLLGGADLGALAHPRTVAGQEAAAAVAKRWRPTLIDVVGSMLSDVAGWDGPGPTFREWLEEGIADGLNAADALETFETIQGEYRFLARIFGAELPAAVELAGRL